MSKYCYAIVHKKKRKLLLEDHKLPIYWNRRVAKERVAGFPDYRIERIELSDLEIFIQPFFSFSKH
jgi:hypothetical protein